MLRYALELAGWVGGRSTAWHGSDSLEASVGRCHKGDSLSVCASDMTVTTTTILHHSHLALGGSGLEVPDSKSPLPSLAPPYLTCRLKAVIHSLGVGMGVKEVFGAHHGHGIVEETEWTC